MATRAELIAELAELEKIEWPTGSEEGRIRFLESILTDVEDEMKTWYEEDREEETMCLEDREELLEY